MNSLKWIAMASCQISFLYDNDLEVSKRKIFLLLSHFTKRKISWFDDFEINEELLLLLNKALYEIIDLKKPIEYIIGSVYFLNSEIVVIPPILIPRIETEFWVNELLKGISDKKKKYLIADYCCGSGCIGIAVLKELVNARCYAFDIDRIAKELSAANAKLNKVSDRYAVFWNDLNIDLGKCFKYDIILSNPPYISCHEYNQVDSSVMDWESRIALCGGSDGMDYIKILLSNIKNYLSEGGIAAIECDSSNIFNALEYAKEIDVYKYFNIIYDQFEKPRALVVSNSFELKI